jgi:hypothetical protein
MATLQGNILEVIGESMVETIREELKTFDLKDSRLYDNVSYRIEKGSVILTLPQYYIYIEKGRRAGAPMPPIDAILKWMARKGIGSGSNKNSIAWAISKSIAQNGIRGRPFLERSEDQFTQEINQIIDFQMNKYLEKEIKEITNG